MYCMYYILRNKYKESLRSPFRYMMVFISVLRLHREGTTSKLIIFSEKRTFFGVKLPKNRGPDVGQAILRSPRMWFPSKMRFFLSVIIAPTLKNYIFFQSRVISSHKEGVNKNLESHVR